ncbi:MAG: glycerophosphodiester phosphodiesterase family protein [Tepidisphaeraceae bacterium]
MFGRPLIIAHRGASADAPENTLASFRLALKHDADALEGDFHITGDGVVVCVHDKDFRRLGHSGVVVAERTYAELLTYDIGVWKSPEFAGERIATLEQVLALVPAGKHLRLEVKAGLAPLPAIAAELNRLNIPADRVRLMSFNTDAVREAKRLLPRFKADWLIEYYNDKPAPAVESVIDTLKACNADGLGTEAWPNVVTPAFGGAIVAAGFDLGAWTVNDVELAKQLIASGVQAITTDRPGMMKTAFAAG